MAKLSIIVAVITMLWSLSSNAQGYSYTLEKTVADPPNDRNDSYLPHMEKLDSFLEKELGPILNDWNRGANGSRHISIEPHVERLKLVRGAARFMVGPFVGGSYLYLRIDVRDKRTGEMLDQREFRVTSNAFKGMISMGERDRNIIPAAAKQVAEYLMGNKSGSAIDVAAVSNDAQDETAVDSSPETGDRSAETRLRELQHLKDQGLITEAEFALKREEILREI